MASTDFDVAVIGSGVGGLCAAARLAHSGYKTLLLEKLPILGGRFSTMEYRGFKLTTGAIWLQTGSGGLEQTFRDVGAPFQVSIPEPQYKYRIGGRDFTPPKSGALRALITFAAGDDEKGAERVLGALRRGLRWCEPSDRVSLKEWLLHYSQNPRIIGVFQGLVSAMHTINLDELPAGEFFRFLKTMSGFRKYGIAPEGNIGLARGLARVVEGHGEVWVRARVQRILVDKGVAAGVVVERDGETRIVTAQAVVSDAGPQQTVELAGRENFEGGYLKELAQKIRPVPLVWVTIASRSPLTDHPGVFIPTGSRRVNFVLCPTLTCPELAPPGRHWLGVGAALGDSLGPARLKEEVELVLEDLRELFPGWERDGELLMVATYHGGWPVTRSWPGYDAPPRTSIENLYNVGDGAKPAGWTGLPACAESARLLVEDIKARIKPI